MPDLDLRLRAVLEKAQSLGFIGPAPLEQSVRHAEGFAAGVDAAPGRFVDLGSGGGLPGLVLAQRWRESKAVLLDANLRRTTFLAEAVEALDLGARVSVLMERAEVAGRDPSLRHQYDLVVARAFGPPAVAAECASPLLRQGGLLIVSEPPTADPSRWPAEGLAPLGLTPAARWSTTFHYQSLVQSEECPTRYPRRPGIPAKRPLF